MPDTVDVPERKNAAPTRRERGRLKGQMKDLLLLLPNLLKLLVRLMRDPRVARADKAILAGTIIYVVAPIDFIPDMIPFIGQIDDSYLVAIALLRLINRTDGNLVAQHWDGEMDVKRLIGTVIEVSASFLPAPIRNALTARIEIRDPRRLRAVPAAAEAKKK
jgi:uncharacterized membrane protein YkvA (DUF1232 family)